MELKIKINTIDLVKNFCNLSNQLNSDVFVKSERYIVDGKSIMGLFSLDLSQFLKMEIINKDNINKINDFIIKLRELGIIED